MTAIERVLEDFRSIAIPSVVFHYTSPGGLLGLCETKTVWASDIRYLNDSQEFQFALDLATKMLTTEQNGSSDSFEQLIIEDCLEAASLVGSRIRLYAASFSTKGDLLSQWRAYCPASGGFAIGFEPTALQTNAGSLLIPCVYDRLKQQTMLKDLVQSIVSECAADETLKSDQSAMRARAGAEFASGFFLLAAAFKHESFVEEDEWRLVSRSKLQGGRPLRFREGRSGVVPYVEMPIVATEGRTKFETVLIGPSQHSELSRQSLIALFQEREIECADIKTSFTPYRAW